MPSAWEREELVSVVTVLDIINKRAAQARAHSEG